MHGDFRQLVLVTCFDSKIIIQSVGDTSLPQLQANDIINHTCIPTIESSHQIDFKKPNRLKLLVYCPD